MLALNRIWLRLKARRVLLLAPLVGFLCVFFVYPMFDTLWRSFGAPESPPSFDAYLRIIGNPLYRFTFQVTLEIAVSVTLLTLGLAYPLAYTMTFMGRAALAITFLAVMVPFSTSVLVRTYAWMVILGPHGLLNSALAWMGLGPIEFLYSRGAVLVGMAYTLLPYMVLTLYSVFRRIDPNLARAAHNLGASDWQVFWRVFAPVTFPGVVAGSLLVFIMALGYFITPSLLGGPRDQMIAGLIYEQIDLVLDWHFGSALSMTLLAAAVLIFAIYARLVGFRELLEKKA